MLLFAIVLPFIAAFFLLVCTNQRQVYIVSTLFSTMVVLATALLAYNFDSSLSGWQFSYKQPLMSEFGLFIELGVDGLSILMLGITSLIIMLCTVYSVQSSYEDIKGFLALIFISQGFLLAAFCALNLLFFYICFEGALLPMYFLIVRWGGPNRSYAAYKFLLYSVLSSLIFLTCLIFIFTMTHTMSINEMGSLEDSGYLAWIWWGLFISFAIKVPVIFLHAWLPDAHTEAPTEVSAILAGITLKLGAFAFIRWLIPLFPETTKHFSVIATALGCLGVVYFSMLAYAQDKPKEVVAYSSMAHMAYVICGIFSANELALQGAILQMLGHGLSSAGLFFAVGSIYKRCGIKARGEYSDLPKIKNMSNFLLIYLLSTIGFPGTIGFIAEFLILLGVSYVSVWQALVIACGLFLAALYSFSFYQDLIRNVEGGTTTQFLLSRQEIFVFTVLAALIIVLGVFPSIVLPFASRVNLAL